VDRFERHQSEASSAVPDEVMQKSWIELRYQILGIRVICFGEKGHVLTKKKENSRLNSQILQIGYSFLMMLIEFNQ
jgi:hypothetical protein